MLRTHTCGELNISNLGETVTLCGWVQKSRDLGGMTFIDVRDRYGLTQLVFNTDSDAALREQARGLGREYVIQVTGKVLERASKNLKMATGEIEAVNEGLEQFKNGQWITHEESNKRAEEWLKKYDGQ